MYISNAAHFLGTKGTIQNVKIWYIFARLSPRHVSGLDASLKYTYWERAHLQQKVDAWDISIRRFPGHFIKFPLWIVSLYEARGLMFLQNMVLEHFTGLKWAVKIRSINTINWIFLPKFKLNSYNPILALSSCTHMRILFISTPLSMQKAFANAVTHSTVMKRHLHRQLLFRHLDWCYTIKLSASLN